MHTDPCNIIKGLQNIIKANITGLNAIIRKFDKEGELHMFTGMRKTLPLDQFPSIEYEVSSGSMDWLTTSAQWCEYTVECTLTVNCGSCIEQGLNYITALSKAVTSIYNWPVNMTWRIPNEKQYEEDDSDSSDPPGLLCEYSAINSIEYLATKDFAIRVSRWSIPCRVVEPFPENGGIGPARLKWRKL